MRRVIIVVLPLVLFAGCNRKQGDVSGTSGAAASKPAEDKYLTIAEEALKNRLKAPSTYKRVSAKLVYAGPAKSGKMGHVYRFEYDAQNSYGAMLRACEYVPFEDLGSSGYHNPTMPLVPCAFESGMTQEEVAKDALENNEK